jgi:hypothetical protein
VFSIPIQQHTNFAIVFEGVEWRHEPTTELFPLEMGND